MAAWRNQPVIYYIGLITLRALLHFICSVYISQSSGITRIIHYTLLIVQREHLSMKLPLVILAIGTLLVGFIPFSNFISSDGKAFVQ